MHVAAWSFILMFHLPSFGAVHTPPLLTDGDTEIKITAQTEDGCRRLQKLITRELNSLGMQKFDVKQDCLREPRK